MSKIKYDLKETACVKCVYTDPIMNFPLQSQKNNRYTQSIGGDNGKFKIKEYKSSIKHDCGY